MTFLENYNSFAGEVVGESKKVHPVRKMLKEASESTVNKLAEMVANRAKEVLENSEVPLQTNGFEVKVESEDKNVLAVKAYVNLKANTSGTKLDALKDEIRECKKSISDFYYNLDTRNKMFVGHDASFNPSYEKEGNKLVATICTIKVDPNAYRDGTPETDDWKERSKDSDALSGLQHFEWNASVSDSMKDWIKRAGRLSPEFAKEASAWVKQGQSLIDKATEIRKNNLDKDVY